MKEDQLSSKIIIPSSVQSDIIINRPNVQYYLALIEAQDSKIKSLKANFYPSFSITGLLSYKSLKLSDLISPKKSCRYNFSKYSFAYFRFR